MVLSDSVFFLIPLVVIVGMLALVGLWIVRKGRLRELEIRERIALIERGVVPPPELSASGTTGGQAPVPLKAERYRSLGVVLIALGVAIALIVGVASGAGTVGLGIGGAIAVMGAAFVVNAVLMARGPGPAPPPDRPPPQN